MTHAFDPELAAVVPMLPRIESPDLMAIRASLSEMIAQLPAPDMTGVQIEDRRIPGPRGDPEVPIRIYRPEVRRTPAAVYSIHGGGFIAGDLDTEHALSSAGGGLCAALALLARDRKGPHIAFQFLAVPELDDRLTTPSMTAFTDTPLWDRPSAVMSWDCYLGPGRAGSDEVSVYAAPARATDLAGLPPAYVSVMHFDPLRDEGIAYALALLAAGVTVELHLFPGTFHGSSLIQHAAISQREQTEMVAVLRQALAR